MKSLWASGKKRKNVRNLSTDFNFFIERASIQIHLLGHRERGLRQDTSRAMLVMKAAKPKLREAVLQPTIWNAKFPA